jgi:hypothetical protein
MGAAVPYAIGGSARHVDDRESGVDLTGPLASFTLKSGHSKSNITRILWGRLKWIFAKEESGLNWLAYSAYLPRHLHRKQSGGNGHGKRKRRS